MMTEVTVAIPFYNAEKYLERAIVSVLEQTEENFDLLLIDDGSTDQSLKIARKFESDTRVKVFSDGKNLNLGNRLNQIPSLTKTEYLMRMDADDIMHPERIARQLDFFKSHAETDVLGSNIYAIDQDDHVTGIRISECDKKAIRVKTFFHPTVMARTEWFKKNAYDVEAIRAEDAELWLRTKNENNFFCLTEPLLFYREIGDKYYRKYIAGLPGVFYILKKNISSADYLKFFLKYIVMTAVYLFAALVGAEGFLIARRNQIQVRKQHYKNFL